MIIKVKNNLTEDAPKTYLSHAEEGTTALRWKNYSGFTANWGIQVGETGEERTEVRVLGTAAVSGTAGTITAATSYAHPADTPVYATKYDQIVFKRSTAGTAGTATAMTDGTITIQADSEFTQFDDTSGSATYGYRTCFRSSGLATNGSDSDWLTPSGHPFYSLGKLRERIRSKAPNSASLVDDDIDDWTNEWLESLVNAAIDVNESYVIGTVDVAFSGTAQYGTIPGTAEFKGIRRADYTENGSDWYLMTKQELTDFLPSETFNETHPYYHMRGDELGRNPHSNSGTIRLKHYKLATYLDSAGDLLPVCARGYTKSFVQWGEAQARRKDGGAENIAEAEKLEALTPQDVKVTLDWNGPKGKHRSPPIIELPPQIRLISVTPDSVEVEIN